MRVAGHIVPFGSKRASAKTTDLVVRNIPNSRLPRAFVAEATFVVSVDDMSVALDAISKVNGLVREDSGAFSPTIDFMPGRLVRIRAKFHCDQVKMLRSELAGIEGFIRLLRSFGGNGVDAIA